MLPKGARRRTRSSPPRVGGVDWDDVAPWGRADWAIRGYGLSPTKHPARPPNDSAVTKSLF